MEVLATKFCYYLFGINPLVVTAVYSVLISLVYFISNKLKPHKKILFLFLVAILPSLFFAVRLILNDYFLSDDYDHFALSGTLSFFEMFKKGVMADNLWAFHRLFTGFWFFKFVNTLFGTRYEAFVLANLLVHLLNTYFLFSLLKRITKNVFVVTICTFIFNSFYLTWISNIHEYLAGFFFLSTFLVLYKLVFERNKSNLKLILLSSFTYVLAIYSKEVTFVLPYTFVAFLIFLKNYSKQKEHKSIKILEVLSKLKLIFSLSLIYLFVFIKDFTRFSSFSKGSGYDTIFELGSVLERLSYYISDRLPIFSGLFGLIVLLVIIFGFDLIKKKLILVPTFASYVMLIFPLLFINKYTSYYNYIPLIFLVIMLIVFLEKVSLNKYIFIISTALLLVFGIKHNVPTQENCFLIQYPRELARKTAIKQVVKRLENGETISDKELDEMDIRWFVSNNYYKYFLNK